MTGIPLEPTGAPSAELDSVRRLKVMAAGVRRAHIAERRIDAPFSAVWAVMADLGGDFGRFQPDMRSVRVVALEGDRVTALARSRYGMRARFEGVVRPGWCWLQSRYLLIGMAAVPETGEPRTRIALTGGVRVPGRAAVLPGAGPELRRAAERLESLVHDTQPPAS